MGLCSAKGCLCLLQPRVPRSDTIAWSDLPFFTRNILLKISDYLIGTQHPPFVIAEVAQSHEGSLGQAMAFIEVAATCGVQAIKFQTHIAAQESTPQEPWRVPFSQQDVSRYDYWQRMEFTFDQWRLLKEHAEHHGLVFLSSPFSIRACEWLDALGMVAWKIASGEAHNPEILDWVGRTGKPILLSGGLSSHESLLNLAFRLKQDAPVALLHCTSRYPTPPEEVGLNQFEALRDAATGFPVGLSDHSASCVPGVVATYLGASLIEVHLTLHERMFGPDVVASLTPEGLKSLVEGIRFAWTMRQMPVVKSVQLENLGFDPAIFGRSWVAACDLPQGHSLTRSDLAYKKPGGGLGYEQLERLLGRTLRYPVARDHGLQWMDFDDC